MKRVAPKPPPAHVTSATSARPENLWTLGATVLLLGVGIYQSLLFWGYQVVPNSDFPAFVDVGRAILSGHIPTDFKRTPGLGLLQVALSHAVSSPYPDLTAGWLLNAMVHPFTVVLIWMIGHRVIGKAAFWLALLAGFNPHLLRMLVDPIAETTLVFLVVLTLFFIFRRSPWAYLFAGMAALIRYEGAILIPIAFLLDVFHRPTWRSRLWALLWAALASVPLVLWMLGTAIYWKDQSGTHYFKEFHPGNLTAISNYLNVLWQVAWEPLFLPIPGASKDTFELIAGLTKGLATITFIGTLIISIRRRDGQMLALLGFFFACSFVYSMMPDFVYHRFCLTVFWIVWIWCWYCLQALWTFLRQRLPLPWPVTIGLQGLLAIGLLIWLMQNWAYLEKIGDIYPPIASIPYVILAVLILGAVLRLYQCRLKAVSREILTAVFCGLMLVSSQVSAAGVLSNGQNDIEFKRLADWHRDHAQPSDRLVTTLPHISVIFAPDRKASFVFIDNVTTGPKEQFLQRCVQQNIRYVAWDSRLGYCPQDRYYQMWGLDQIAPLGQGKSIGPFEFITRIEGSHPYRFINLFRFHAERLAPPPPPKP